MSKNLNNKTTDIFNYFSVALIIRSDISHKIAILALKIQFNYSLSNNLEIHLIYFHLIKTIKSNNYNNKNNKKQRKFNINSSKLIRYKFRYLDQSNINP